MPDRKVFEWAPPSPRFTMQFPCHWFMNIYENFIKFHEYANMILWCLMNQWIFYDLLNSGWMWFAWLVMSLQRSISMHALALLGATKWTLDLREIPHSNGCSRDLSRFAHGGHSGAQCWSCCRPSPGRGYKSHWSQRTAAWQLAMKAMRESKKWRSDDETIWDVMIWNSYIFPQFCADTWPVRAQHAHSKLVVHDAARGMITFDKIKWELSHLFDGSTALSFQLYIEV